MRSLLTVFVCIYFSYCVFAQQQLGGKSVVLHPEIDEIVNEADALRSDGEFENAIETAKTALERSQKVHYDKGSADSYMQIGRAFKDQERYKDALANYELALHIRRDILNDKNAVARTYNSMSSAMLETGEKKKALNFSNLALENCSKDNLSILTKIYTNLGNIYDEMDSVALAIKINQMGIALFPLTHDTTTRLEIGYGLAKKLLHKKAFGDAQTEIQTIIRLAMAQSRTDSTMLGHIYELNGIYFLRLPVCQPDSALFYFEEAKQIFEKTPLPNPNMTSIFLNMAESWSEKKNLPKALEYYQQSLYSIPDEESDGLPAQSLTAVSGRLKAEIDLQKAHQWKYFLAVLLLLAMIIITVIAVSLYLSTRSLLRKEIAYNRLQDQNYQLKHDIVKNGLQAIDNYIKSEMHDLTRDDAGYPVLQKTENMVSRMLNKVGYPVDGTQEATTLKPFVRELHLQAEEIFRGAQNYSFLDGVDDYPMSKELRSQLEAIVTEAFTNIYKYANCTVASFCVEVDENGFTLTIEDDGIGFDTAEAKRSGLRNMELRSDDINARCKITSETGKGTKIEINIPVFPERPE